MSSSLPIDVLQARFMSELDRQPVVVSAPTGSGKSTRIPVWCAERGRVLVIEPRRVACRSLAQRVAETEGQTLGEAVGYLVRDERRAHNATRITFVTPGVALRLMRDDLSLSSFDTVVLDEFHERGMDTDLILALLKLRRDARLVVMSATIEGDRLATHLTGLHLEGEGRMFPVDIHYQGTDRQAPSGERLDERVARAVLSNPSGEGHTLVFLPGKREIAECQARLRKSLDRNVEVLALHGGLSLEEQSRVFADHGRRKVILSTNVAETSLTVPGVDRVVDSGLVRRTCYRGGRGFLTLTPIALDSADQRAGRAGRTGPGRCIRLWSPHVRLQKNTPPEVYRESLLPLVFNAAAVGVKPEALQFLDVPKSHALESARNELRSLEAIDEEGGITETGAELFGLPLDVALGRLLIEARTTSLIDDVVDLVAVLMQTRNIFYRPASHSDDPKFDLRHDNCDAAAAIRAINSLHPDSHFVDRTVQMEARRARDRLRKALELPKVKTRTLFFGDRKALAMLVMKALPTAAHIARPRKRATSWANGGTEIMLGKRTAVAREMGTDRKGKPSALLVLETRALGRDALRGDIVITSAMPVPMQWLAEAGLGKESITGVKLASGGLMATLERTYAGRTIGCREGEVEGDAARKATLHAMQSGRLWKGVYEVVRERLQTWTLYGRVKPEQNVPYETDDAEEWLLARLELLGLESGADIALVDEQDLLPEELSEWERDALLRTYPMVLEYKDVRFRVEYDLKKRVVRLHKTAGRRRDPPPRQWLPRFQGLRILMVDQRGEHPIRG